VDFLFLICNVVWAHTKGILGDTEDLYSISLYLYDFSTGVFYVQLPSCMHLALYIVLQWWKYSYLNLCC